MGFGTDIIRNYGIKYLSRGCWHMAAPHCRVDSLADVPVRECRTPWAGAWSCRKRRPLSKIVVRRSFPSKSIVRQASLCCATRTLILFVTSGVCTFVSCWNRLEVVNTSEIADLLLEISLDCERKCCRFVRECGVAQDVGSDRECVELKCVQNLYAAGADFGCASVLEYVFGWPELDGGGLS